MAGQPLNVLFLCTGNSARSQMAEAILRHLSHGSIEAESAGTAPQPNVHPMAQEAVKALLNIDMTGQHPKTLDRFLHRQFDYVITVCDHASESCPTFPGNPERIHWSVEDPAASSGTEEDRQRAFDSAAKQLLSRIRLWLALPRVRQRSQLDVVS